MIKRGVLLICQVLITMMLFIACMDISVVEKDYGEVVQEKFVSVPNGDDDDLNKYLTAQFNQMEVAGMAVAIVENDDMTFFSGNGYMNIKDKEPVRPDTIFLIASITKTTTGTAVMQLVEKGLIDLDKDINEYLPYDVYNPEYTNNKITTRMLLCHTSSILDNWDVMDESYSYGKNPEISLQEYCEQYFDVSGKWYDEYNNYLDEEPGTYYEYSNCGYALLGNIVENITGKAFYEYCDENIFEPLGMNSTSLMLEDLDIDRIAIPYVDGEELEHYTFATYPDGGLRTSSEDFIKFISIMINDGTYKNVQILKKETVDMALEEQYIGVANNQGLTWDLAINEIYNVYSDDMIIGHNGGEHGAETLMFLNQNTKKGALIFINDELSKKETSVYDEIVQTLVKAIS